MRILNGGLDLHVSDDVWFRRQRYSDMFLSLLACILEIAYPRTQFILCVQTVEIPLELFGDAEYSRQICLVDDPLVLLKSG